MPAIKIITRLLHTGDNKINSIELFTNNEPDRFTLNLQLLRCNILKFSTQVVTIPVLKFYKYWNRNSINN